MLAVHAAYNVECIVDAASRNVRPTRPAPQPARWSCRVCSCICYQHDGLIPRDGRVWFLVRTYNVHHFEGMDGAIAVDDIAAIINEERPDLVGLQEVDRLAARTDGVDFPKELETLTGMRALFGPNLSLGREGAEYGNAILSRLPIKSWANHHLRRMDASTEQRGLLSASVVLPTGKSLTFATTHLEHTSAAERSRQVAMIHGILSTCREPLVLCGDFNARPGSAEMQLFESWGLADAWEQAGDHRARDGGFTIPSVPKPHARIDYVLLDTATGLQAIEARVAGQQNPGASDHLPVVADLRVETVPRGAL